MTFSVVIATLGRPDRLRRALADAAAMVPPPLEIVVVDGDSERSAQPVAEAASGAVPVVYIAAERGSSSQRNVGMDAASGDVAVFLDDDAALEPHVFSVLAEVYADPTVVAATGPVEEPSSNRVGGQRSPLRRLFGGTEGTFMRCGYPRRIVDNATARDVEFMPGCFMSARMADARVVRFDETLPGYALAEDEDFSYRLSRRGRIRFDPRAVVHHDNSGFAGRDRRAFGRLVVVHRHYLFRKNFAPSPLARLQFAGLLAVLVVHRLLNADVLGARGILDGAVAVLRGEQPS